jgi:hypothetical protein
VTTPAIRLKAAEAEAAAARERLSGTVSALQNRLDPSLLADEAKAAGTAATLAAVDGARRNPAAVAGIVGALGLFIARHRLVARWRHRKASKPLPAQPRAHPAKD